MSSNTIMLVFGDGRHGHNLAREMCCYNEEHKCFKQIVVVVDKSFEKNVEGLRKSCKVIAIDFGKQKEGDQMAMAMNNVMSENNPDWMVVLPTGDSCTPAAMKCCMDCYQKKGGKNVVMCSKSHAEEASKEPISRLKSIEKLATSTFPKSCIVLRCQMAMMELDYFIEDLKEKHMWRLPLGNGKFSPITKCDEMMALGTICKNKEFRPEWAGKVLNFTNTNQLDGQRLAELTGSALNMDTKFENMEMEEAREKLKKFVWHSTDNVDTADKKGCMYRKLTSMMEVEVLMFNFQMIMNGKYDFVTNDFKDLTGKEPMSVEQYLRKNQDRFKGSE